VNEGEAPEAGEASGEESIGFDEIPESVFDKKQDDLGKRRKPAGPPLQDDAEMFGIEGLETPDVPETEPGEEVPESEGV
jgi:hypothetical protein